MVGLYFRLVTSILAVFILSSCTGDYSFKSIASKTTKVTRENVLPGTGSIDINAGADITNSLQLIVNIEASELKQVYITEDSTCNAGGQWQNISAQIPWTSTNRNSEIILYAKFSNGDLVTDCVSDSIMHDDIAPVLSFQQVPPVLSTSETQNFLVSAFEAGSGLKELLCQLDNEAAMQCELAIVLNSLTSSTHKLKVVASDKAGNVSLPIDHTWTIDNVKPVVQIFKTPEAITSSTTAIFTFDGQDIGSGIEKFECKLDSAEYTQCTTPITYSNLLDGSHTFYVRATDKAGLVSDEKSYTWIIDTKLPEIRFTLLPEALSNKTSGSIAYIATDSNGIKEYKCALNSNVYSNCSTSFELKNLKDGTYTFKVYATDNTGMNSMVITYTWKVDATGPVVRIVSAPQTPSMDLNANIAFIAEDINGIGRVECSLNSASFTSCTSPIAYNNLEVGPQNFKVRAYDLLGNLGNTASHNWNIVNRKMTEDFEFNEYSNQLDILIVLDNSESMINENDEVYRQMASFLPMLKDVDYQISMITTDSTGSRHGEDGKLVEMRYAGHKAKILTPNTERKEDILANTMIVNYQPCGSIVNRMQAPLRCGSNFEEPIHNTMKAIHRPENSALFRDGAHLASVIISDQDEAQRTGEDAYLNQPESLISLVKEKWQGKKSYSAHAMINHTGDRSCFFRSGGRYGEKIQKLAELSGGSVGSLCDMDYSKSLKSLLNFVGKETGIRTLACEPLDINQDGIGDVQIDIVPKVNYEPTYKLEGKKLTLNQIPPKGSKLKVSYRCL